MHPSPHVARRDNEDWSYRQSNTACVALIAFVAVTWLSSPVCALFPPCDVQANCSGHASIAVNATSDNSICNCTCLDNWNGSTCGVCPARFNQTTCDACNSGYNQSTYPKCDVIDRPCTIEQDCNAKFAKSASGTTATGCQCSCKGQAVQPKCDCPVKYEQNVQASCNLCAYGYDPSTFPQCIKLCNVSSDCPPRTVSVTGNIQVGCHCVCLGGWTGPQCDVCPSNWDAGSGCINCAFGYSKINNTCTLCGVANCSFHGAPIPSDASCRCSCQNQWTGASCEACPIEYDQLNDCVGCNTPYGYKNVSGVCVPPCTSFENCSNHASDPVLLNLTSRGCDCVCRNKWSGGRCQQCLYPFDPAQDCGQCLPGMAGFPNCTNVTTTEAPSTTTGVPTTTSGAPTSTSSEAPTTTVAPTTLPPKPVHNTSSRSLTPSHTAVGILSPSNTSTMSRHSASASPTESSSASRGSKTPNASMTTSPTSSRTPSLSSTWHGVSVTSSVTSVSTSRTPTTTASLCANTVGDCIFRTNNSVIEEPPQDCFCVCRNQWSEMFCNYCHPRYNDSADCGSCFDGSNRRYVIYPRCDHILYVKGNLSVPLRDPSILHSLVRSDYFDAIATDVTTFLNTTLRCFLWSHNITGYVISWIGGNNFTIDVELLDQDMDNNTIAAECVLDGLLHNLHSLEFTAASELVQKLGGTAAPSVTDSMKYFDLSQTTVAIDYNRTATPINPCAPHWCDTIPPIRDPEEPDLTWVIALFSILGIVALAAAAVYFLWYRPRELFRREYRYRRGADVDFRRVRDLGGLEVEWCTTTLASGDCLSALPAAEEDAIELSAKTEQQVSAVSGDKPKVNEQQDPMAIVDKENTPQELKQENDPSRLDELKKEMFDSI